MINAETAVAGSGALPCWAAVLEACNPDATKALLMGEFTTSAPEGFECHGITVDWTTIKEIQAAILEQVKINMAFRCEYCGNTDHILTLRDRGKRSCCGKRWLMPPNAKADLAPASGAQVQRLVGQYRCIVADPPWSPSLGGDWSATADKGRPQRFYGTMSLENIIQIEPPSAPQAHLYLWTLTQHIDWGYLVAKAWGFDVCTMLTWCKPGLGVGRFQCNTEHVLVCRKGSRHGNPFGAGGRNAPTTGGTHFNWPRGRHSEKPDDFYALVERLSQGPRLDVYARRRRDGWDAFGNEVDGSICLPNAKLTRPAPDEMASTGGPSPARVERLDGQTGSRETP